MYPKAFTAKTHTFNYAKGILERGEVAYDAENERYFIQEQYRNTIGSQYYEEIVLFKQEIYYQIDRQTKVCHHGPIPRTKKFHPFGVPANATFHAQVTSGLYPTVFNVNEFGLDTPHADGSSTTSWHSVTEQECFPTTTTYFNNDANGNHILAESETVNWYNAVIGIVDPDLFIPPQGCTPFPPPGPRPPSPTPPAPPSPPGPPVHRLCRSTMEKLCGNVQNNQQQCVACIRDHQAELSAPGVGCVRADEAAFCHVTLEK